MPYMRALYAQGPTVEDKPSDKSGPSTATRSSDDTKKSDGGGGGGGGGEKKGGGDAGNAGVTNADRRTRCDCG